MEFINRNLTFTENSIYYIDPDTQETHYIMMDWEKPIMKAHADYICSNGGDILEIGFGMGISADYIQANNIKSHTIVECHPQVYNKAQEWAEDKPNVNIILGDWYDVRNFLSAYDGLFFDTWGYNKNGAEFKDIIKYLMKKNGLATWWNSYNKKDNQLNIKADSYDVIPVKPNPNLYFNYSEYYLPKKQF